MKILKKLNNNVALAQDGKGYELIVFGKGVGFPAMPYELTDLSGVQRTFYNVDPHHLNAVSELPQELIFVAGDIAEKAADELDCPLNPNLPFTLADHIQFALERAAGEGELHSPLAFDVEHLYPREFALGCAALDQIARATGTRLPDSEAVSVALHLINAESESEDMHATMVTARVIGTISDMVEDFFEVKLDKTTFQYSRFVMHLRYLVQRMLSGKSTVAPGGEMLRSARRGFPALYTCAVKITDYLAETWGWQCGEEEQLYLMMHIDRVKNGQ